MSFVLSETGQVVRQFSYHETETLSTVDYVNFTGLVFPSMTNWPLIYLGSNTNSEFLLSLVI